MYLFQVVPFLVQKNLCIFLRRSSEEHKSPLASEFADHDLVSE